MEFWFTLTSFGDEISSHLDEQLGVLKNYGITYIELRSVGGKGILDFDKEELHKVKKTLNDRRTKVSCLASPIGKTSIIEAFATSLERFKKALDLVCFFETKYIRVFSYYIPLDRKPEKFREKAIERMRRKTELAAKKDIVLLHENEKKIYGDTHQRCIDILEAVDSPDLRAIFDPANFVQIRVDPVKEAFPLLHPYIEYIHIKDALFGSEMIFSILISEFKLRGFESG